MTNQKHRKHSINSRFLSTNSPTCVHSHYNMQSVSVVVRSRWLLNMHIYRRKVIMIKWWKLKHIIFLHGFCGSCTEIKTVKDDCCLNGIEYTERTQAERLHIYIFTMMFLMQLEHLATFFLIFKNGNQQMLSFHLFLVISFGAHFLRNGDVLNMFVWILQK